MKMTTTSLVGSIAVLTMGGFVVTAAFAQHAHMKAITAETTNWAPAPPLLPKGAQFAVLFRDPTKPGPFVVRLKVPAGYKIPAHSHPSFEAVTIISGEFNLGTGDKLDESKVEKLAPGGFIFLHENMNHFAFATTGSIVQINSVGPFDIKYVNPADDPRNTQ